MQKVELLGIIDPPEMTDLAGPMSLDLTTHMVSVSLVATVTVTATPPVSLVRDASVTPIVKIHLGNSLGQKTKITAMSVMKTRALRRVTRRIRSVDPPRLHRQRHRLRYQ